MRKFAAVAAGSVLGVAVAMGGYAAFRVPKEAMTADLERDLNLAATVQGPRTGVVSAIEQGRNGAPSGEALGKRMVVPTKRRAPIAAPSPTVMETPAATVSDEAPQPAPTPAAVEPVAVAASEPQPVQETAPSEGESTVMAPASGPSAGTGVDGEVGHGSGNMRRGGIIGAVAGAIIRGASVGHDRCEPRGTRGPGGMGGTTLGDIGGIILSGRGRPSGSIPGGAMPGGRRR